MSTIMLDKVCSPKKKLLAINGQVKKKIKF